MKKDLKFPGLLLFFSVLGFCCYAQPVRVVSVPKDSVKGLVDVLHLLYAVHNFKDKMKIQELELRTMRGLDTVDSLQFGKDSLIVNFYNPERKLLKKIVQKYRVPKRKYDYSTVYFYNETGLLDYSELWHIYDESIGTRSADSVKRRSRLTCRRYEYDEQGRLVRYVGSFPTPITMETLYTYHASGNPSKTARKLSAFEFWDERKE